MVTQKFKDERIAGFTATTEEFRVSQMPRIRENISEGLKGKVSRRNRGIEPWNLVMGGCGSLGQHYVGCSIAKIWSNDVSGWEDYWLGTRMEILSNVVFMNIRLGGGLLNSVNEFLSLEQGDDVLVAVEATPTFGGRFSQLEHHNQARFSIATALRFSVP